MENNYCEKYEDLTLHQRISIKGFFHSDNALKPYRAIMLLWNFKIAVNHFLTNDINLLISNQKEAYNQ